MTTTSKFPKLIEVIRAGRDASLLMDGEPFPYAVASVTVSPATDKMPTVMVELLADRVTVSDTMASERGR